MWERETFENAIKTIYIKLSDLADPEPDVSSPEAENDTSLSDNGASDFLQCLYQFHQAQKEIYT